MKKLSQNQMQLFNADFIQDYTIHSKQENSETKHITVCKRNVVNIEQ